MTLRALRVLWRFGGCDYASTYTQPRSLSSMKWVPLFGNHPLPCLLQQFQKCE